MNPAVLRGNDITLRYGNRTILKEVNLSLPQHSIIGLVGINGSGKSSLMKILAGILDYDEGEITKSKSVSLLYVPQDYEPSDDITIESFLGDVSGNEEEVRLYQERLTEYQQYFSIPTDSTKVATLSGGQKRQLIIYKSLALNPDILLLDEPTNHLDLKTMIAIQSLFKNYPGTILMISHDRYFLDSCVDTIWELDDGILYTHPGTYSQFLRRKQKRREDQTQAYLKLKQEYKREHEWFNSGVKARGTKDQGRIKRYYEIKRDLKLLKPRWKELKLPIPKPLPLGNKILNLQEVSVPFPHSSELVIEDLNCKVEEGMRIGLLGPNGSGKTTLLRAILGKSKKLSGKISIGINTDFNYHDQSRNELNPTHTIHYTISEDRNEFKFGERKINIYAYLKKFLFDSDDLKKYVSDLSGGEKARLLLAKILKTGGNFLVLDEPTNDLDLDTIQALENSLTTFNGCVLLVSHDRFFLDNVCTHILALEGNGTYTISTGGYSRYINQYQKEGDFWKGKTDTKTEESSHDIIAEHILQSSKQENHSNKPKLKTKEIRQIKAQIRLIETQIKDIEGRIKKLNDTFSQPDFYTQSQDKIIRSHKNMTSLQEELQKFENKWLHLTSQIE
jgi:ATP-binding cassette subfamily F protein uup